MVGCPSVPWVRASRRCCYTTKTIRQSVASKSSSSGACGRYWSAKSQHKINETDTTTTELSTPASEYKRLALRRHYQYECDLAVNLSHYSLPLYSMLSIQQNRTEATGTCSTKYRYLSLPYISVFSDFSHDSLIFFVQIWCLCIIMLINLWNYVFARKFSTICSKFDLYYY